MAKPANERSLERKVRNSYVISTVSIALVLFLLGSVGYLISSAMQFTDSMKEGMVIHVMLKDKLSDETKAAVGQRLIRMEEVREARYVTREEAAADFKKSYTGGDFENFLGFNPLPDSYEITLKADFSDKNRIRELDKKIASWNEVDEVVYQRAVAERITTNINKFNWVLLLFGGTLLVISLILLNNTIRLTIYSKRYLINTMKLVGASPWFILKPFLTRSIGHGLAAWLIAAVMFVALIIGLSDETIGMAGIANSRQILTILGCMLAGGVLISALFTTFAVRKFVRMNTTKIYLY